MSTRRAAGGRTRREVLRLAAVGAAGLAVAACAPKEAAQGASPTPATAVPTAAQATATTAAAQGASPTPATAVPTAAQATATTAAKRGQLVISLLGGPPPEPDGGPPLFQKYLTDAYKKVQPGVELLWEWSGLAGDKYPTWLGTQLAASQIRPDIVSGNYAPTFTGYVNFDKYRKAVNPYTGHAWDKDLDWDFWAQRNAKGERYMLATRSVHIMWIYNKDIFARVGVTPPSSWQELADVCAKLKASGVTPISTNYKWQVPQWLAEVYFDQYHVDWIQTVRAQPGDWNYDPDVDGKFSFDPKNPNIHNTYTYNVQRFFKGIRDGKLRYDTPEMAELVKSTKMIFPGYATSDFWVIGDPYPPFLSQRAAIMLNGTWQLGVLANDLASLKPERKKALGLENVDVKPFEWGIFENPPMTGPLVKSPVRSVESATGRYLSVINKSQQQTELAIDFLMFFLSKPGYSVWIKGAEESAARAGRQFSASGPGKIVGVPDPPSAEKLFKLIKFIGNAEANYNNFLNWGVGKVNDDAKNLYRDALLGKVAPEEFGKGLQRMVTDNFDAILKAAQLTRADIENPARQPGT